MQGRDPQQHAHDNGVEMSDPVFRYALIGAGSFGRFCLEEYRKIERLKAVAIADIDMDAAREAADEAGDVEALSVEEVMRRHDIELVHIATPPFTHRELVLDALKSGKHVLCEKPLAVELDDAQEMLDEARRRGRVLSVNLIMRYNPLCEAVKKIVDERLLGEPLHGFMENYAGDEKLKPSHWFWDVERSGGIFVEHAVHFFDLFRWWLCPDDETPVVLAAQQSQRPGHPGVFEQVHATLRYPQGVLVNHYHGFTQPQGMDRQEMRLVFERGTIRLFEWVPTRLEIDFLGSQREVDAITRLLPDASVGCTERFEQGPRKVTGRFKTYEVDGRFRVNANAGMPKQELYGHVVRSLLCDQLAAMNNPAHVRRITEENGLNSLAAAVAAQTLADAAEPQPMRTG